MQLLSVLCGNVERSFSQTSLDKIFHTTPHVRRKLGTPSVTNATQAEKTTAIPPHSVRQKISLQIDISVSKKCLDINILSCYVSIYLVWRHIWHWGWKDTNITYASPGYCLPPAFPSSCLFVFLFVCLDTNITYARPGDCQKSTDFLLVCCSTNGRDRTRKFHPGWKA